MLTCVIKGCSQLLSPLDDSVPGNSSSDKILWLDGLLSTFNKAKSALLTNKSIVLPKPTDQLWSLVENFQPVHECLPFSLQ